KCHHWAYLPLAPDVVREMRASMRELQPELDDFVFTVEVEQWVSQYDRVRKRKNPRCRRANRRSGGWFIAYASAQECRRFPLTSFDTASRTGSFAKAGVTLQRCGRCWVIRGSIRRSSTPTRSSWTNSGRRLKTRTKPARHKRRPTGQRSTLQP